MYFLSENYTSDFLFCTRIRLQDSSQVLKRIPDPISNY